MSTPDAIIRHLDLVPLPFEGGYYRQTWKSSALLPGQRCAGTAIYFLLTADTFSAFHRVDADEIWHFYAGDPVEHWQLRSDSGGRRTLLGSGILSGETPQIFVAAGLWQAAKISSPPGRNYGWSLLGCTMCPGWEAGGFILGLRNELTNEFPDEKDLICALTRADFDPT